MGVGVDHDIHVDDAWEPILEGKENGYLPTAIMIDKGRPPASS